jgi:predicted alpha/beta hydrolase family esterase
MKVKQAVILHAMDQTSEGHWYPWLKSKLENHGYKVWCPNLPHTDMPDNEEVVDFLLNSDWNFSNNLIIGHSSGAMQLLYLLQNLPAETIVDTAVMVSSFDHPVAGMEEQHQGIFKVSYDFEKIKSRAKHRLFIQGADDPWCPVAGAKNLANQTDSEIIIVDGGGHFSTSLDPTYTEFPKLLEILDQRSLL